MSRFNVICVALTFAFAVLVVHTKPWAEQPGEKSSKAMVRVGTFDSRAVTMAYIRSEAFERRFEKLKAEHEKAKAAGDKKRVEELEAQGRAGQEMIHRQGFGTWPVDNILETIKEEIPGIAKQAGVDIVVSKWDVVYQRSGVELVDITDLMVQPFDPDEATLKVIQEVVKQDPVPLEDLKNHKH